MHSDLAALLVFIPQGPAYHCRRAARQQAANTPQIWMTKTQPCVTSNQPAEESINRGREEVCVHMHIYKRVCPRPASRMNRLSSFYFHEITRHLASKAAHARPQPINGGDQRLRHTLCPLWQHDNLGTSFPLRQSERRGSGGRCIWPVKAPPFFGMTQSVKLPTCTCRFGIKSHAAQHSPNHRHQTDPTTHANM